MRNSDERTPQEFKQSEERLAGGSHARDRRESQFGIRNGAVANSEFGMRISDSPRTRALAKCDWLSGTYARDRRESQCGMENELLDMFADANSITSEASNKVLTRKNAI